MADLEEIKTINADLPLTTFPNEIDGLESFSDADDEINSAIIMYKNYIKQGETSKAEEVYEKYSLKKYIVSAYFLNKIQQMIIACERAISSVKKYFTFSVEQPTSTTVQPNGYIWGKILSVGDNFKKVLFKLKENDSYIDIYPQTTSDNVLLSEEGTETVKDNLDTLNTNIDTKMDKSNPTGTGSFAMNLGDALIGGDGFNSVSLGTNNTSVGKNSMAFGAQCQVLTNNAIAEGLGLVANVANQHVSGKYNASGDFAQIIGGGNSNEDRKNIYTVDWNGNVKGNSISLEDDVIYNQDQSLIDLSNKVSTNTSQISTISSSVGTLNANTTSLMSSSNYGILNISFHTSTASNIAAGETVAFIESVPYYSTTSGANIGWLFIPRGMSERAGQLDVDSSVETINDTTATISFTLKNISSTTGQVKIGWYWVLYQSITKFS